MVFGPISILWRQSATDLKILLGVVFFESWAYFGFTALMMIWLKDDVGFSDTQAGYLYAAWGVAISIYAILFGGLVDVLLPRRTLILHVVLGLVSSISLGLFRSSVAIWIILLGPFAFSLGMGGGAVGIALKNIVPSSHRPLVFALRYTIMNIGALAGQFSAEGARLLLVPAVNDRWSGAWGFAVYQILLALLHAVALLMVVAGVRDIRTLPGEWACEPFSAPTSEKKGRFIRMWTSLKTRMTDHYFWRFVLLCFAVVGARSVFRSLDAVYPDWMRRAPFPVDNAEKVPFILFLGVNPLIVILCSPLIGILVTRHRWHLHTVILVGSALSAAAPFFMIWVRYSGVFCFLILLSLGESIWSAQLNTYAYHFAPAGSEGIFFSIATVPTFASKILIGVATGWLLSTFCPSPGPPCDQGWYIWLVVGLFSSTTPIFLALCAWCLRIPDRNLIALPSQHDLLDEFDITSPSSSDDEIEMTRHSSTDVTTDKHDAL